MRKLLPLAVAAAALLGGCDSGGGKPSPPPTTLAPLPPGPYEPVILTPAPEAPPAAPASDLEASPSPSAAPAAGAEDPLRKAVKAYFARMDQVLRAAPKHAITGEIKNADVMLINAQKRAEEVRKVEVPEPCAEHHRRTLELLESAISLADRMRVLRDTQDQNALLAFGTDRASLDEQERQIDALAAEIKQLYP